MSLEISLNAPADNPFDIFSSWFSQAKQDDPDYYNGMNIATVDHQGQPSSRVVLLKSFDNDGFIFYTNYLSRKGHEMATNNKVAATFWWSQVQRQIRIEGAIEKVPAQTSDDYFYSRPRGSQLAAITSQQSQPIESLTALEQKYREVVQKYEGKDTQRPEHWGGYRIIPQRIEFWQGLDHRLHHRLVYCRDGNGWRTEYIQP
ncbi:MAG: pyridoxamine 5'-phosphate oxidase [Kangiellaceae bacterium]|jgi:pyridoxamine 5'-phosphate oxidase|nr:pyridoxamine 5'-phosphate oxidase [Kangiellaceae bacterium]